MTPPEPCKLTIDASVAIKLYLHEEQTDRAEMLFARLADSRVQFFVPELFEMECANIFWKLARRGQITPETAGQNLTLLRGLPLTRVNTCEIIDLALQIALQHDVSVYDACYLATAQLKGAKLVTADSHLVNKLENLKEFVVLLENAELS